MSADVAAAMRNAASPRARGKSSGSANGREAVEGRYGTSTTDSTSHRAVAAQYGDEDGHAFAGHFLETRARPLAEGVGDADLTPLRVHLQITGIERRSVDAM